MTELHKFKKKKSNFSLSFHSNSQLASIGLIIIKTATPQNTQIFTL